MKKAVFILGILIGSFLSKAQVAFKTIVTALPVTVGESFQVQYIIDDARMMNGFKEPSFNNFRLVSGPNVYNSAGKNLNGLKQTRNTVYTLMAIRPGRFIIAGAVASINGKLIRSNDVEVHVITKEAGKSLKKEMAVNLDYFLAPGEDPYEKIRRNLFLKMNVDKKTCYVGEPVLATFKLYSRLESRSDIVKNPGFYGFTVYDMLNLDDKQVTSENIYGKLFDVHIIRKVQLYPLQSGSFTIDEMEVKNRVEFSRSAVNKKTEQEIVEGVLANNGEVSTGNVSTFETDLSTEPVNIFVKPAPVKNKPVDFYGAIGNFNITAALIKSKLAKNEQDFLEIKIGGKGNFIQLSAPLINWPAGIEGFEPGTEDNLDKNQSPLSGSRTFRYPFVAAKAGKYIIPPVGFSFFNSDSGKYKTLATGSIQVEVNDEEKSDPIVTKPIESKVNTTSNRYWFFAIAVILLFSAALFFRNKKNKNTPVVNNPIPGMPAITINEILAPSYLLIHADDKSFYTSLQQSIWKFFSIYLHFSGSEMNKRNLAISLKEKHIEQGLIDRIQNVLQVCESGIFTRANLVIDKNNLVAQVKETLEEIEEFLF